mgnify:CR=1 FL=1|tara:strand:+ start:3033 stop:3308 length:276 start_codon:yes stop_codon:yes gene_type:complete
MKPWEELRKKHAIEVKELLEMFSHLTIVEASRAIGLDSHALRTHAFRFGVEFTKSYGGKTSVETDKKKIKNQRISLPKAPWNVRGEEIKRH